MTATTTGTFTTTTLKLTTPLDALRAAMAGADGDPAEVLDNLGRNNWYLNHHDPNTVTFTYRETGDPELDALQQLYRIIQDRLDPDQRYRALRWLTDRFDEDAE